MLNFASDNRLLMLRQGECCDKASCFVFQVKYFMYVMIRAL